MTILPLLPISTSMMKGIVKLRQRSRGTSKAPSVYVGLWDLWTKRSDVDELDVDWDHVISAVQKDPGLARFSDEERRGMLLLHLICALNPPLRAVEIALQANPLAPTKQSHTGLTPMHIACGRNASRKVIQLLLTEDPKSIERTDHNGQTALDYTTRPDVDAEILHILLMFNPRLARHKSKSYAFSPQDMSALERLCETRDSIDSTSPRWNRNQWTKITYLLWASHYGTLVARNGQTFSTLHAALARNCPADVLEVAFHLHGSDACGVRDIHGNIPLHYAMRATAANDKLIRTMLEIFPLAASTRDSRGNLAFFEGLKHGRGWFGGLQHVVKEYPVVVAGVDPDSGLPAALLAAQFSDLETIFILLRGYPQVILSGL
jgi:ankyrin repeat protein